MARTSALAVALVLVGAACAGGASTTIGSSPAANASSPATTPLASPTTAPVAAGIAPADCGGPEGEPWTRGESVEMVTLIEEDGIVVRGAIYPHPDYRGKPWSQWGQGLVLADGRYLSAIGDHLGADGNSFVYEFDPSSGSLTQIVDLLAQVDHVEGEWGFGKVHAQMVAGPCDDVYLATYWGNRKDITYTDSYGGDRLFRIDPAAETIADYGVIHPERGVPSLASWVEGGLIYAETVDPTKSPNQGEFVAIDAATGETVFVDDATPHVGYRAVAVDGEGRAYFAQGDGRLAVFDPQSMSVSEYPGSLPGEWLRAATAPAPDGTIYAVTREPDQVFAMTPDGSVTDLGPARGYVASLVSDPEGTTIYYVPEAHGRSFMQGTPLIAVDTDSGEDRVVVEMNAAAEEILGVRLGGTYNMAITPDGSTIYIGMNAGPLTEDAGFGEVVLLEVRLSGS